MLNKFACCRLASEIFAIDGVREQRIQSMRRLDHWCDLPKNQ